MELYLIESLNRSTRIRTGIENAKVGDVAVCYDQYLHDYVEHEVLVNAIEDWGEDGGLHLFGEDLSCDDEEMMLCTVTPENFVSLKCPVYWKPEEKGYTSHVLKAGFYSGREAEDIVGRAGDVRMVPLTPALLQKGKEQCLSDIDKLEHDIVRLQDRLKEEKSRLAECGRMMAEVSRGTLDGEERE